MMLRDLLRLHRPEGTEADMERDIGQLHALGLNLLQKLRRKVQSGRRCGGRAADLGVDRLIALAVGQLFLDIGRERHFPEALQNFKEDPLIVELHQLVSVVAFADDRRGQRAVAEGQFRPGVRLSAGLRQALPNAAALVLEQQHFHRAHGRHTVAQQTRGKHARIVQHQAVARVQQIDKLVEMTVSDLSGRAVQRHEPGGVAPLQRRLRDQLLRQVIVKIVCFQQVFPLFPAEFQISFTLTDTAAYAIMKPY